MPFHYNRDTYAQVLEKAKATLRAKTTAVAVVEDPLADDLKQLKTDAKALAKKFGKDQDTYGTETFENLGALTKAINGLKPTDGDVRQRVAEYRAELDAAAIWYDVEFQDAGPPGPPPAKGGTIFDDIRQTPDILGKVTPYQLLNYNLANALFRPAGRSKFFQKDRPMTLATASLAATAWLNRDAAPAAAPVAAAPAAPAAAATPSINELELLVGLYLQPPEAGERVARFLERHDHTSAKELIDFIDQLPGRNNIGRAKRLLGALEAETDTGPLPDIAFVEDFIQGALIVAKRH